jgi:hypothetical protein
MPLFTETSLSNQVIRLQEEPMFAVSKPNRLATSAFVLAIAIGIQCSARAQQETAAALASSAVLSAVQSANGKWGYQDTTGAFVIPPQFDSADVFSEGLARVELHRKWGYVDVSGRVVIPLKFVHAEPFTDGLALVYTTWGANIFGTEGWDFFRRAGYINHDGKFVIGPRNTLNARGFSEGIAPFQPALSTAQSPKWGYLDKSGKWAIKPQFDVAAGFSEGLAAAAQKKSEHDELVFGYIDHAGRFVIPPQFHGAEPFRNGIAVVFVLSQHAYVDRRYKEHRVSVRRCIDK